MQSFSFVYLNGGCNPTPCIALRCMSWILRLESAVNHTMATRLNFVHSLICTAIKKWRQFIQERKSHSHFGRSLLKAKVAVSLSLIVLRFMKMKRSMVKMAFVFMQLDQKRFYIHRMDDYANDRSLTSFYDNWARQKHRLIPMGNGKPSIFPHQILL